MSFSLLPLIPPVPAPVASGAAAPVDAAAGFGDLMAALFGEASDPVAPAPALGAAQSAPAGQIISPEGGDDAGEEPGQDDEEGVASEAPLAAAILAPAPLAVSGADAAATAETTAPVPTVTAQASPPPPAQAAQPLSAPLAPADATETTASAAPTAAADEVQGQAQDEAARSAAGPGAQQSDTSVPQDRARPGPSAETPPPVAQAVRPAARPAQPITTEAQGADTASAPTATAAPAQAASQPMMTAAAAAGVVSLRAGQVSQTTATGAPAETKDEAEPAPKAAAGAKGAFAAQAPSPFALTPAAPVVAKADNTFAPQLEPAAAEATPSAAETFETVALDSLDNPDTPGALGSTASGASPAEVREGVRPAATTATVADLAAQVSKRLEGRSTHFEIQLTPEGLGRVDVRVDIDAQGKLTAAMAFDNPHAANEMRGRSGELMRALEQAGFDLSGGLSFNAPQDQRGGGQFADQAPEREAWQGRAFQSAMGMADEADTAAIATRLYQQRQSPTGVDLRI